MQVDVRSREQILEELLKEARKIIRASSARNLAKDWDVRVTHELAKGRVVVSQAKVSGPKRFPD